MNKPKISVIIPIYNVEFYLDETLTNMTNQTFIDDIEVIMIDDGSTDNSRYIIEKYALNYDNFYAFHKENEGQSVARNLGLHLARGEYVHFMDSDDLIVHDAYEKLYNLAKKGDYDVITFNHLRFDDNNNTWKTASAIDVFNEYEGDLLNTNLFEYKELSWDMANCNKLMKKELLDEHNIRYPIKHVIYEDNLFMIKLYLKANKVAVLKDYVYFWRHRQDGTSTTQKLELTLGKQLYEMVYLVNQFITANINDKEILNKKYEKLLTINLYFFLLSIKNYPKEHQKSLFEDAYNMAMMVPEEYYNNLNTYFQVLYIILKEKNWDELLIFLSYNFKINPIIPQNIDSKYSDKLDFKKDSTNEQLNSNAKNVCFENNELIIEFNNYVPFNKLENLEKINFKIINLENNNTLLLNTNLINENKLHIPINLINIGENNILTEFYFNNIKKESYMETPLHKTFNLENFEIEIKQWQANRLRIIKREKNNTELKINDVEFNINKIQFKGFSNKKINNIILNDYFDIAKFTYPINFLNENEFTFDIDYMDFLKSPVKKWEISSDEKFNKISLKNELEFINEQYIITLKNQNNKILIEFKLYDPLTKVKELNNEINSLRINNNKLLKITSKLNPLLDNTYESRKKLWEDINNSKKISDFTIHNKNGIYSIIQKYKQLEITTNDKTVVRIIPNITLTDNFEITFEIKVTDYANIGISNFQNVTNFAYIRINNKYWTHYRFIKINTLIFAYTSIDGGNAWEKIEFTENRLNINEVCQFQFNCGYSNSNDKKVMIKNIKIYKI